VQAHLRSRIAAAAGELASIADSPDLLGYRIARPEGEQASAPAESELPPSAEGELPAGPSTEVIDASSVSDPNKSFEGQWANDGNKAENDEAFQRFFSSDVDPEPTQQWILAG
jgi:hypothetical protein